MGTFVYISGFGEEIRTLDNLVMETKFITMEKSIVFIILIIPIYSLSTLIPIEPETEANKLLSTNFDELILILTGDTQYYFPCTFANRQCKAKSTDCREKNKLTEVGEIKSAKS